MTILSISEAARTAGVDRSTIQRAIRAGRLSAVRDATGRRGIDTAELHRVYPPAPQGAAEEPETRSRAMPQAPPGDAAAIVELLREQLRQAQDREGRLLALLEQEQAARRRDLEQQLLPGPRQGLLTRLAEALAQLRSKPRSW